MKEESENAKIGESKKKKLYEEIEKLHEKIIKSAKNSEKINYTREVIILKANIALCSTMDGGEILKLSQALNILAKECQDAASEPLDDEKDYEGIEC